MEGEYDRYQKLIAKFYSLFISFVIFSATFIQIIKGNYSFIFIAISSIYFLIHAIYASYKIFFNPNLKFESHSLRIIRVAANIITILVLYNLTNGAFEYYILFILIIFNITYRFHNLKMSSEYIFYITFCVIILFIIIESVWLDQGSIISYYMLAFKTSILLIISFLSYFYFRNSLHEKNFFKIINKTISHTNFTDRISIVLDSIAKLAIEELGCELVTFYMYDDKEKILSSNPFYFGKLIDPNKVYIDTKRNEVGYSILENNQNLFIKNTNENAIMMRLGNELNSNPPFVVREKIVSSAAIILKLDFKLLGIMFTNYRRSKKFSFFEKRIIEQFGYYASISLKNALDLENIVIHTTDLATSIYNLNKSYYNNLQDKTHDKIFELVLNTILNLLKEDLGYYARFDELTETLNVVIASAKYKSSGLVNKKWPSTTGITGEAIRTRKVQILPDVNKSDKFVRFDSENVLLDKNVDQNVKSCITFPLNHNGKILGVFHIESYRLNNFSQRDAKIIESLSNQALTAIHNKELLVELNNLSIIDRNMVDYRLSFEKRLEKILCVAHSFIGHGEGNIVLYDQRRQELEILVSTQPNTIGVKLPIENSVCGLVVKSKSSIYIPDVSKENSYKKVLGDNMNCELAVPLIHGDKVIGILNFEDSKIDSFSSKEIHAIERLAGQISIGIQFLLLSELNQNKINVIKAVEEIDNTIIKHDFNLSSVFSVIIDKCQELIGDAYYEVILFNNKQETLEVVASTMPGKYKGSVCYPKSVCGEVICTGKAKYIAQNENCEYYESPYEKGKTAVPLLSSFVIPLIVDKKILGLLNVEKTELDAFSSKDIEIMEIFANQTSIALMYASVLTELQKTKDRLIQNDSRVLGGLSDFISGKFHALGNNISGIKTDANSILLEEQNNISSSSRQVLSRIINICDKLNKEADKSGDYLEEYIDSEKRELNFHDLIKEAQKRAKVNKHIKIIEKFFAPDPVIRGNSNKLQLLILELFNNAIDAISSNGEIIVSTKRVSQQLHFEVTDNGCGIPDEDKNKLYARGFTTKNGHSGKGLHEVYLTVKSHEGEININSDTKFGTNVKIIFPLINQ